MPIKGLSQESYVSGKKEIKIKSGKSEIVLFVKELGYLAVQHIYANAHLQQRNPLALLVAESVSDAEGSQFTYDEVINLKQSIAKPMFEAVSEVQGLGGEEKK